MESLIIIGGGGTGAALAYDLAQRGFEVSLFEKGELFSGTTGRHHGLLHSGARYAVHDREAAIECIQENRILRKIAPQALEQNDGLFVAISEEDCAYANTLLGACRSCGIDAREISSSQALDQEPALTRDVKTAVQVPDGTIDAWRLPLHFVSSARAYGAEFFPFHEIRGIDVRAGSVVGIDVFNCQTQQQTKIKGDLFINATGAWAGRVAKLAGIEVPIQPGPGVMVAVEQRLTDMVINRMHEAGEGDIIVPQRGLSLLGTSLWLADDPEMVELPRAHIDRMIENCAQMVPAIRDVPIRAAWSAARPLVRDDRASEPQHISRTFHCYDHKTTHNLEGFVSIIGGKATTLRAMAESAADLVCRKTGRSIPCRTLETPLVPYRSAFRAGG